MKSDGCYVCGNAATTREHVPPKSFFPKGCGLQLKTVPSCPDHNNAKSNDDQYLLAHISMHAASENTIAKQRFMGSIAPHLHRSPAFHQVLREGSVGLPGGARQYKVDVRRFNSFFDHFACAIYYDRYGFPLDRASHEVQHVYLSLRTEDLEEQSRRKFIVMALGHFYEEFQSMIASHDAGRVSDESIYTNRIMDPAGAHGSITIAHTFYGVFDVVSLLSRHHRQDA